MYKPQKNLKSSAMRFKEINRFRELASLDDERGINQEKLNRIKIKSDWLGGWSNNLQKTPIKEGEHLTIDNNYLQQIQQFLEFYDTQLTTVDNIQSSISKRIKGKAK
jgi:hypothetical protein